VQHIVLKINQHEIGHLMLIPTSLLVLMFGTSQRFL